MDPVTLAILAGTAGTALSGAGTLIGGASLQRENKKRLEELKRKEEMGALGLTDKERAAIEGRLREPGIRAQQSAQLERERLLAGSGGATAGAALGEAAAKEQALMSLESQVASQVLEQDLAKEQRQKDEMRALEAAIAERRREAISAAGAIGAAGLEAGLTTAAQQAVIQGPKDISPSAVSGLANQLGVSQDEARGLYELSLTNPEMFKYLTALQSPTGR